MSAVKLPPGPRGRLRCTLKMLRDPVDAVRAWRAEYGDTFSLPLLVGDWVITGDPERVKQIFSNRDPELFSAAAPDSAELLLGRNSVLRQAGESHPRDRKLLLPPFHGERMRGWARTMAEAGREAFTRAATGQPLRALDSTRRATLDVILRLVFGVRDEARLERFRDVVDQWAESLHPVLIFLPIAQRNWLGLSPYARFRRRADQLDAMLLEQIAATRAATSPSEDVLTMLVHARYDDGEGMSDAKLLDNLRTLLFAGHDTTAISLAWAIELVHRNPSVLSRLRAELDALGDDIDPESLSHMSYLNAVIDETLRFRPVSADALRTLRKPREFGEWVLPAKTTVTINTLLLHDDPRLWDRPEQFMPERFLAGPPSANVFVPFGGGSRRCLGATFARFEAAIVLGTLLREFEFELLDERVELTRGKIVLEPSTGVSIRVQPRARPST